MSEFLFSGKYRVQSRRRKGHSSLSGDWFGSSSGVLTSDRINAALAADPRYNGIQRVNLRAADVLARTGMFANEPDILYKMEFFEPEPGTAAFPANIVDVQKSVDYWHHRWPFLTALFREHVREIAERIKNLPSTIVNEYFCHEAGHSLGIGVEQKYDEGYFRPAGRTAWSLVWSEEFRADLHSFGYAKAMLSSEDATSVFLYNILLRFGLECESTRSTGFNYGTIPFLLFSLLRALGFLSVVCHNGKPSLRIESLDGKTLCSIMTECDAHATRMFTSCELDTRDLVDSAIGAARYHNEQLQNETYLSEYRQTIEAAAFSACT